MLRVPLPFLPDVNLGLGLCLLHHRNFLVASLLLFLSLLLFRLLRLPLCLTLAAAAALLVLFYLSLSLLPLLFRILQVCFYFFRLFFCGELLLLYGFSFFFSTLKKEGKKFATL